MKLFLPSEFIFTVCFSSYFSLQQALVIRIRRLIDEGIQITLSVAAYFFVHASGNPSSFFLAMAEYAFFDCRFDDSSANQNWERQYISLKPFENRCYSFFLCLISFKLAMQALAVLLCTSLFIPCWYAMIKHVERHIASSSNYFRSELQFEIAETSKFLHPLNSSATNLARVLGSSLNGTQLSFSQFETLVCIMCPFP